MAEKCAVCGYFADSGRHDTVETCDAVRGPCLDPDSHHPFVGPQPAHDALRAAAQAVVDAWDAPAQFSDRMALYVIGDAIATLRAALEGRTA